MKKAKSIISAILCAAILLSCAPVFNLNLFSTQASAASYTKKHEKEYYYAPGTKFITYLVLGYSKDNAAKAKAVITRLGSKYTAIDKDLNDNAGGRYIFLGYLADTDPTNSIKDLRTVTIKIIIPLPKTKLHIRLSEKLRFRRQVSSVTALLTLI